jgi:FKBP-type peptidyl-prolyl cis-trans isomerase FkpA
MKHISFITVITVCLFAVLACGKKGNSFEENFDKNASYALGVDIGTSLKSGGFYPDLNELAQGIRDVLNGADTRYTLEEAGQLIRQTIDLVREQREEANKKAETDFLAGNSEKPGITVTDSGLQYEVITEGDGPKPEFSDTVRVHYEGTLIDGTVFDSSYNRGEPAEFPLSGVIPGWTEGLQLMNVGSKYRLFIPSDIGYGPMGAGPQIPPFSTLIFEVELLDIVNNN